MKKTSILLIILLIVSSTLIFYSCDTTSDNTECAKECYNYLAEAHEICDDLLGDIYNAWYFALYEADDCSEFNAQSEFLNSLKFYNDIETTPEKNKFSLKIAYQIQEMGSNTDIYYLSNPNAVLSLVKYMYSDKITRANELLSSANITLKSILENQEGYSTLKSYYLELKSCLDFCQSPDTSFEQLGTTRADYQKNLNEYKNELEFILN